MSAERLTLEELLEAVEIVDAHIDAATSQPYRDQPLAADWARVTKVCEEAGEVWRALSKMTGENPRKGVCGTRRELLGELADTASAAICAIQHLTKDTDATWAVVSAALAKARRRVAEQAAAQCICVRFNDTGGVRVADLTCPVHGVGGTNPGDRRWDGEVPGAPVQAPH